MHASPTPVGYSPFTGWKVEPGDVRDIKSESGLDQGCPLASPAYGISTATPAARALETMLARDSTASLVQRADDAQIHTKPADPTHAHQAVSAEIKQKLDMEIQRPLHRTPEGA